MAHRENEEKALLGFCKADAAQKVNEFDQLQVIKTSNEDIIGIAIKEIDTTDTLDLLSAAHSNLIELIKEIDIIPVKIGTVIKEDVLKNDLSEVESRLNKYKNKVESILRADYDEDLILGEIIEELKINEKGKDQDKVRLGQDVYEALAEKRAEHTEKIISEIEKISSLEIVKRSTDDFRVCDISILSNREQVDKIEKKLNTFAKKEIETIKFTLVSPLPIYNFLE